MSVHIKNRHFAGPVHTARVTERQQYLILSTLGLLMFRMRNGTFGALRQRPGKRAITEIREIDPPDAVDNHRGTIASR